MSSHDRLFDTFEQFLTRCLGMAEAESMERLAELDLPMSQVRAIFCLAQSGEPVPINGVAERLGLSVAAAGRAVDRLVQAGLVERRESSTDRRVKLVSVTRAGIDVTDEHIEAKRRALRSCFARLTDEQADALVAALAPLLAGDALRPNAQETPA